PRSTNHPFGLIPIFELVKTSDREWFGDCQVLKLENSVWMSGSGPPKGKTKPACPSKYIAQIPRVPAPQTGVALW
ncbi:MAG: hypothetical protein V4819_00005, partial [Verrucomicrobiota bacterium]